MLFHSDLQYNKNQKGQIYQIYCRDLSWMRSAEMEYEFGTIELKNLHLALRVRLLGLLHINAFDILLK